MRASIPGRSILLLGLALAIFALQEAPRLTREALAMDEEWDLANAVFYWKDFDATLKDGPLPLTGSLTGLPSRFMPLTYGPIPEGSSAEVRAYYLLYYLNRGVLDRLALSGRLVSLLFGLGVGILLWRRARDAGMVALVAALVFWAFDPMLLGYSGIAKNDLPAAFLAFATLEWHRRMLETDAPAWDRGWIGMLAGAALLTKPTTFFVVPALLGLEAWQAFGRKKGGVSAFLAGTVAIAAGVALWIFLAYLPTARFIDPPASPFAHFARYLGWIRRHGEIGNIPYFLGAVREGWGFLAFPVGVFFKWTLPFTLLVCLGAFLAATGRIRPGASVILPILAMALTLVPAMGSKLARHLLPVYPYLILLAAQAFDWAWTRAGRGKARGLVAALLIWHALTSLANFPRPLSYMNDLVPRDRKAWFLSSYHWDLNQDTKELARRGRERGWGRVRLANSGRVDPHFYGLSWDPWTLEDLASPQPGTVYVMNASLLSAPDAYLGPFAPVKRSWVASRPPTGRVGDTWVYFEIPGTPSPRASSVVNSFPYYRLEMIPYRITPTVP